MNGASALLLMTDRARQRFPEIAGLDEARPRSILRSIRYAVRDGVKAGVTDAFALRDAALAKLQLRSDYASILTILGLAVLKELLEWGVAWLLQRLATYGDVLA